eukprot:363695-Chlamydomonas_euryale.AAC.9
MGLSSGGQRAARHACWALGVLGRSAGRGEELRRSESRAAAQFCRAVEICTVDEAAHRWREQAGHSPSPFTSKRNYRGYHACSAHTCAELHRRHAYMPFSEGTYQRNDAQTFLSLRYKNLGRTMQKCRQDSKTCV